MRQWVLFVLLFAPFACAQEPMQADANSAAENEVKNVEMDLAQRIVKGDLDQYAAQLMDDFEKNTAGALQDKAAVMKELRSPDAKILDLSPEDLKVRVYGETAIVTGHFTLVQRRNGRVDTFFTREMDVFLKRNGRWMLAAEQATAVAK
ncbi:MAG TPA: nuclear transport factor 2 family protein [Terriglobales bacterium]|nr:nuclear transport factor 2 family protein [Terriglobales bacterium]